MNGDIKKMYIYQGEDLESDLRKSTSLHESRKHLESLTEEKSLDINTSTANPKDFQNNLILFQQSLER